MPGSRSTPAGNIQASTATAVNAAVAKLNDLDHIFYLDIGPKLLDADGKSATLYVLAPLAGGGQTVRRVEVEV
jgi:hypothetical protein